MILRMALNAEPKGDSNPQAPMIEASGDGANNAQHVVITLENANLEFVSDEQRRQAGCPAREVMLRITRSGH